MNATVPLSFASAYRQLNSLEKGFVDGFVRSLEDEAAARGERISGALYRPISPEIVARSRGLLDKPLVRAAIVERINEIAVQSELTVQKVIRELRSIAFASHGDYMTVGEDGMLYYDFNKCTPEQLSALKKVKLQETESKRSLEVETHDKMRALEMLGKYMGIFEADNPHWRAENAKPINETAAIPGNASDSAAADLYARAIND